MSDLMVVSVENAPLALRGRLSLWLVEVRSGFYVGVYSIKVREYIWETIEHGMGKARGNALMIWKDGSEMGFSMRTIGKAAWCPVELDGLKLIGYDGHNLNSSNASQLKD